MADRRAVTANPGTGSQSLAVQTLVSRSMRGPVRRKKRTVKKKAAPRRKKRTTKRATARRKTAKRRSKATPKQLAALRKGRMALKKKRSRRR